MRLGAVSRRTAFGGVALTLAQLLGNDGRIGVPSAMADAPAFVPKMALTMDGAQRAMRASTAEAVANSWKVTIVIVDDTGAPVLLERQGAAAISAEIAMGKARTAALLGKETAVLEKATSAKGDGRVALVSAPLTLMEGGVPIIVDGVCVGAIGVSGVKAEQDAQIAKKGVAALSS